MTKSLEKYIFTINWNDELILGVEEIDNQHRKLADAVNENYKLYTTPTSENVLIEAMDKLINLFANHFDKEYEILEKYDVSNKEEQLEDHEKILSELCEIRTQESMPVLVKVIFINQILLYYLKEHLLKEDKESIMEIKAKRANS